MMGGIQASGVDGGLDVAVDGPDLVPKFLADVERGDTLGGKEKNPLLLGVGQAALDRCLFLWHRVCPVLSTEETTTP